MATAPVAFPAQQFGHGSCAGVWKAPAAVLTIGHAWRWPRTHSRRYRCRAASTSRLARSTILACSAIVTRCCIARAARRRSPSKCWVQRHDGGCRAGVSVEPMRARAGRACGGRTPPLRPATRTLTYLPPEPSALAVPRPYLLTPSVWCGSDLGKLKKYETQVSVGRSAIVYRGRPALPVS